MSEVTSLSFGTSPIFGSVALDEPPATPVKARVTAENQPEEDDQDSYSLFGKDGFDFFDLLDIINPLQHIPLVSTLYRRLTGDQIGDAPKVLGGAIFGGPLGAVASLVNIFVEQVTGKEMGEHVFAMFSDAPAKAPIEVAAQPQPAAAAGAAALPAAQPALAVAPVARQALAPVPGSLIASSASPLARRAVPDLGALGPLSASAPTAVARALDAPSPSAAEVLRASTRQADAFAATNYRATMEAERTRTARRQDQVPDGAVAQGGGWFSEVMLAALEKYDAGAKLAEKAVPPTVNILN